MGKNKSKTPDTFLIIFGLIIIVAILTWIIPAGEFDKTLVNGKEVIDGNSFHKVESNPQGIFDVFTAPIKGIVKASLIIGFVLIVGGAFSVFQKTGAITAGISAVVKAHENHRTVRIFLIPIFMTLFSLGGAIFGMSEEVIPFILIFIPMALMLGYDSVTGVAIPFVGAGVGFAGAFLNPFTVGIAQGIAGIPVFSGMGYRITVWFTVTAIAIFYVTKYASKIKNNPKASPTYEIDKHTHSLLDKEKIDSFEKLDTSHKLVLITFLIGLVILVIGVLEFGWYIEEISALFLGMGITVGILGKLKTKEITGAFVNGAKDLVATALIIGLARAILVIAEDGKIIGTLLYYLSEPVKDFHPVISSQVMFAVQTAINFFVPSGSGQAALTMPIMAPLSDLVGVSRQTAVLAFQLGDGFTNLIIPTSAVTMGILTLAKIPWPVWAKWILPLQIILFIAGLLLLIPPFYLGW